MDCMDCVWHEDATDQAVVARILNGFLCYEAHTGRGIQNGALQSLSESSFGAQ